MISQKKPHTWIVIVFILAFIFFCCIGSVYISTLYTESAPDQIFKFISIVLGIFFIAVMVFMLIDRQIYNRNLDNLAEEYNKKTKILEEEYQVKLNNKTEEIIRDTKPIYLHKWFDEISNADYKSEKEVETKFIYPLIRFLGYEFNDIHMQHSMKVPIGRQTVPAIADFIIDNPKTNEPFIVIEAKITTQKLDLDVQNQARSYAFTVNALYYLITNGIALSLYKRDVSQDIRLIAIDIKNIQQHWEKLDSVLGKKHVKNP